MLPKPTLYLRFTNGYHKLSIGGVVFYVEDCCCDKLTNHIDYLNSAKRTYHTTERIAELLLDALREKGGQVISPELVQYIIKRTRNLRQPD